MPNFLRSAAKGATSIAALRPPRLTRKKAYMAFARADHSPFAVAESIYEYLTQVPVAPEP